MLHARLSSTNMQRICLGSFAHIPERIGYGWKEMMSGGEIVKLTNPNL
jgi:hypothetical protein